MKKKMIIDGTLLNTKPTNHTHLTGIYNDPAWLLSDLIGYIIFSVVYFGIVGTIMYFIFR